MKVIGVNDTSGDLMLHQFYVNDTEFHVQMFIEPGVPNMKFEFYVHWNDSSVSNKEGSYEYSGRLVGLKPYPKATF